MVSSKRGTTVNFIWAIVISTFAALVLKLVALPPSVFYFWPDWIVIVVVFWSLHQPDKFGPISAFVIGILLEVLFVRNFGVISLGLACLAYVGNFSHQQLRALSPWQQMFVVGFFIGVYKLVTGWLLGLVSEFDMTKEYWYSLLGDILIWPFAIILLHELRRMMRLR